MKYKNGLLSAWFGILQQLITLVFGLIVPRLFIQTFGSEVNGMLSSIGNLYGYLALVEAGVATVSIQALYGPVGRDDKKCINEIMSATAKYYNKAGLIYLLGVISLAIVYPMTVETNISKSTIFMVVILSGAGGVINFWVQGKYMVLLNAEGKKYLMSIVTTCVYVCSNITKIIMLILGYDVVTVYVGYFFVNILQMIFYFYYMRRNYKWLNLKTPPNMKALSQRGAVLVQQITWMICNNTDILVLTYVARDLKAVSVYNIYLLIYAAIERLFSTLFGSFHYMLGQKFNNDYENYMPLHRAYEKISVTGAFALYTIAYVLTTPFIRVYTTGITDIAYVDKYLPLLFAVMHLLSSSKEACSRVINFAGHFKQMQWRAILESVINLVASIVLVLYLGIYGVILGTIIAYLWRTNDIIIYANKQVLKRSSWETYIIGLINVIIFFVVFIINRFVNLNPDSFVEFILIAIPTGIVVCSLYFFKLIIFDKEEIKYIYKAIVNKKSKS